MSGDGAPAAADVDRALRRLDLRLRRGRAQSRRAAARPAAGAPILPAQRTWTDQEPRGRAPAVAGRTAAVDEDVQSSASRVTKP